MKKLHFFNLYFKKNKWKLTLMLALFFSIVFYVSLQYDFRYISPVATVVYLYFFGYELYKNTRKNSYIYMSGKRFKLRLDGKKLEVDSTFISNVWPENGQLHIQRINRVDSFNIAHLNPEHVTKLIGIIKEQQQGV
jgi:hypothetical protein